jgi:two-component system, LuxR family, sensor kinase FixL
LRTAAALLILAFATPTLPAEPVRPKVVVILDSFGPDVASFHAVAAGFRSTLSAEFGQAVEFHQMSLDAARFTDSWKEKDLARFLRDRFDGRNVDLLVPIGEPAMSFLLERRKQMFRNVPMLITATEPRRLPPDVPGPGIYVVSQKLDLIAPIDNILNLLTGTTQILIVLGHSPPEQFWTREMRREYERFAGRAEITFVDDLPLGQILGRAAALPPGAAILFGLLGADGAGMPHDTREVLKALRAVARVPIFSFYYSDFGEGVVGGPMHIDRDLGVEAAGMAAGILKGQAPSSPLRLVPPAAPAYDWRELHRWGISETRLPPGAEVLYRRPSLWQSYRSQFVALLAVLLLQALLITGLVIQRARRRKAEAALGESESNVRSIVETTAAVPWEADATTWVFTFVGPQAEKLLGYPREKWYEKDFWINHVHPEDRDLAVRTCMERSSEAENFEFEYRMIASSGAPVWIHDIVHCQHSHGKPVKLRGLLLDVTERRQANEKFRLALEATPSAVVMVEQSGRIVLVNDSAERLFGYTRAELIGSPVRMLVPERLHVAHMAHESAFFSAPSHRGHGLGRELLARRKDGTEFPAEITLNRILTKEGSFVLAAIVDISARRRSEAALREQRRELAHITRISTLGELAASLAHELNQPLTAIRSNAQAAQRFMSLGRPSDFEEVREVLAEIIQDNNRAGEVIRRLRALARKENLEFAPIDLAETLAEASGLLNSDAIMRNVRVRLDLPAGMPAVRGDRIQVQQVALNLLSNAFDAMKACAPEDREVVVELRLGAEADVVVAVRDRGTGLSGDTLSRVFQSFYTTKRDGLGMGLSISRSIVEAHGGRIWAENNAVRGATFYFSLPLERSTLDLRPMAGGAHAG